MWIAWLCSRKLFLKLYTPPYSRTLYTRSIVLKVDVCPSCSTPLFFHFRYGPFPTQMYFAAAGAAVVRWCKLVLYYSFIDRWFNFTIMRFQFCWWHNDFSNLLVKSILKLKFHIYINSSTTSIGVVWWWKCS